MKSDDRKALDIVKKERKKLKIDNMAMWQEIRRLNEEAHDLRTKLASRDKAMNECIRYTFSPADALRMQGIRLTLLESLNPQHCQEVGHRWI